MCASARRSAVLVALVVLLASCRAENGDRYFPARELAVSRTCLIDSTEPALVQLTEQTSADDMLQRIVRSSMMDENDALETARFDVHEETILLVDMGMRRTGGYAVRLTGSQAVLRGQILSIPVQWIEPAPNAIVTQVITHPCMLIAIAKGGYRSVAIIDQHGRQRLSAVVK
jgi:hypothetical protein